MAFALPLLTISLLITNSYQRSLASVQQQEDLTFFIPPIPTVTKEQINDVLSHANVLRDKASQHPIAVAAAIAAAVGTLPPISFNQALRVLKSLPGDVHLHLPAAVELLARIRSLGTSTECRETHGGQGPPGAPRILIAADLNDCEEIMPYWILEVLRLALVLQEDPILQAIYAVHQGTGAPQLDLSKQPEPRTGISVYESGSKDNTGAWLEVARALWTAARIPNNIVTNGSLVRQIGVMDPATGKVIKQHRIQHLANLRNSALQPLYDNPTSYQYVMFINDVFFCAPELVRLSYLQADIACGIDLEVWIGGHVPKIKDAPRHNRGRIFRRHLASEGAAVANAAAATATTAAATATIAINASAAAVGDADTSLGGAGGDDLRTSWQNAVDLMTQVHANEAARQAETNKRIQEAVIKPRYEFYDIWVARDIGGTAFIKHDPLARDLRTVDAVHRGLPFPVKCCWNGAVLLNASHLAAGLRFRPGMRREGECDASECSLLCEDYRRLGSGRVAMDPSVRVSYAPWTEDFHGSVPGGLPGKVPWSTVKRSGALERMQSLWKETAQDMFVQCVPLRQGFDGADLDRARTVDLRRDNFTATFLQRQTQPSPPPKRSCNLVMGGYGATTEGEFFDDLSYASWGRNVITRIVHRAGDYVHSLQVVYGVSPAKQHGGDDGELHEHTVEAGEFINRAVVYYDDTAVIGLDLRTNVGRRIVIGTRREGVSMAKATPCPADPMHEGRYRLIAFAGTADKSLRSVTLFWS